ncbi:type IV pilus biogenesis protein PilM [Chloroflexota bacterium]
MITLEISSTDIRLMETDGDRVIRWASRSLEPGMFEEEVIVDPQALGAAIKQLMTSSGITGRNVTASVSGLYSLNRMVTVSAPDGVTREAVLEAAIEVMPLSEDELYLSWQTVAPVESGEQVLVVGVPRDVLDSEVQALKATGINPRVLDLKAMALTRAVNREQALILNIQPSSFDIILVVNGVAEIMRTSAWQPDELTVEEKAEDLAVALELTLGFYNSHRPGFPLELTTPFFVTGQMSGDPALVENIQARLEYPFEPFTPPLQYPEHLPVSQYAVNIGLALKGTATARSSGQSGYSLPNINLLPDIYQPWKPSAKQIYYFLGILAAIALLLPLYQLTTSAMNETASLKMKSDTLDSVLERRQIEIRNRVPLQEAMKEYNTIVNMGGGFAEDVRVIINLAEELGIKVQSITHSGSSVTVICQANSSKIFRSYVTALRENARFSTVAEPPFQYVDVRSGTLNLKPNPGQ